MSVILYDIGMNDELLTVRQVRAGRALLAWSQAELASAARVATSTIADFERGVRTPVPNNVQAIREALESNGLRFLAGGVVSGSKLPKPPSLKPGALVRWISATDLAQWGERRDGQGGMPELLRRLIFATLGPAAKVVFPSDGGRTDCATWARPGKNGAAPQGCRSPPRLWLPTVTRTRRRS